MMGGLPLGRLGLSIPELLHGQIILDKPRIGVYYVRTLNKVAEMKPTKTVIKAVAEGRTVINTTKGMYRAFKTANWFLGESRWEIVAPNGKEWVLTISKLFMK